MKFHWTEEVENGTVPWEIAYQIEFPRDKEEFETIVIDIRNYLRQMLFANNIYKTEYFLTGYESAYKIVNAWYKRIANFEDVYSSANKEIFLHLKMLLDDDADEDTQEQEAFELLYFTIPEQLNEVEANLFSHFWILKWYHDVFFSLKPYSEDFREGEYTLENIEQWRRDYVSADKVALHCLLAEVYEYVHLDQPKDFKDFVLDYLEKHNLRKSFFVLTEEN